MKTVLQMYKFSEKHFFNDLRHSFFDLNKVIRKMKEYSKIFMETIQESHGGMIQMTPMIPLMTIIEIV